MTKVYSSYLANIKNIPDDVVKVFVFLYKPPKFSFPDGSFYCPQLAPNEEIFKMYKNKELTLKEYLKEYEKILRYRIPLIKDTTLASLAKHKKICLICYEKNEKECHRFINCNILNEMEEFQYEGEIKHA